MFQNVLAQPRFTDLQDDNHSKYLQPPMNTLSVPCLCWSFHAPWCLLYCEAVPVAVFIYPVFTRITVGDSGLCCYVPCCLCDICRAPFIPLFAGYCNRLKSST